MSKTLQYQQLAKPILPPADSLNLGWYVQGVDRTRPRRVPNNDGMTETLIPPLEARNMSWYVQHPTSTQMRYRPLREPQYFGMGIIIVVVSADCVTFTDTTMQGCAFVFTEMSGPAFRDSSMDGPNFSDSEMC